SALAAPRSSSAEGTQPDRPRCSWRRSASAVCVVVRRPLAETMSRYLVDRIEAHPRVEVRVGTAVTGLHGDPVLERVTLTGPEETVEAECRALFSFIGA